MRRSRIFSLLPPFAIVLFAAVLGLSGPSAASAAPPPPVQLLSLGKCLSVENDGAADGSRVVLASCAGRSGQNWQLPPRGFSGQILGPGGKCLDVTGSNPADRTPIILFSCHGLPNQTWRHELDGRIVGLADKCLDVLESGTTDGTPLVLFQCNSTANQLWTAEQRNYFHSEPLLSEAWLFALAASPALPDRIFAAASTNGILRSENGGLDWASANRGVSLNAGVQEIAVDPLRPDYVYALENGRLLRSSDGGRHFDSSPGAPVNLRGIAIDPRQAGHVLALNGDRFFESFDSGRFFGERAFPTQQSTSTLQQLIFDPLQPGRLWIAAATTCPFCTGPDQGVFRSDDGGATWIRVFSLPSRRVVADPHAAGQIYALVDNQLHRSTSGGAGWQLLATFAGPLLDVWADSAFPGRIVVAHQQGLSRSLDGGASFLPVALDLRPGNSGFPAEYVRRLLYSGGRLLAALDAFDGHPGRGVIASTDFGATWELRSQRLFAAGHIVDIETISGQSLEIWVAGRDGVYQSMDGGVSYSRKLPTEGPAEATALLVDPYDSTGKTLYAAGTRFPGAAGPFLWKTTNGGGSWQAVAGNTGQQIETGGLIATRVAGKRTYLTTLQGRIGGTDYHGILVSENENGSSWKPLDLGVKLSLMAKGGTDLVLFAGGDALMRSLDGGATWELVQALGVRAIAARGEELFFAGDNFFYRSTDRGITVQGYQLPSAVQGPKALLLAGDVFYLGDHAGGVFSSTDGGRSWTALDLGLPHTLVNVLQLDPRDSGRLFAGTSGAGLQQVLVAAAEAPLVLGGDRFTARITWRDFLGAGGAGRAGAWTADSGFFWFFQPDNVEVMVKVLDGRSINGKFWVFVGSLSNVEFDLTMRDENTGQEKVYHNPLGHFASFGDIDAFPGFLPGAAQAAGQLAGATEARMAPSPKPASPGSVVVGGRFEIEVHWEDGIGQSGEGFGQLMTGDTAAFNFFSPTNTEVVIKVLDGRGINGHFWVFYGALSDVGYTIKVRDLETGALVIYQNPLGTFASVGDISAF